MIIVLKKNATDDEMQDFIRQWKEKGYGVHVSRGEEATILGLLGDTTKLDTESVIADPIVEDVKRVTAPYKMANRAFHPDNTVIVVGTGGSAVRFGCGKFRRRYGSGDRRSLLRRKRRAGRCDCKRSQKGGRKTAERRCVQTAYVSVRFSRARRARS